MKLVVSEHHTTSGLRPHLAPVIASRARSSIPAMSRHITAKIQKGVGAYSGHPDGRRQALIETAVRVAITYFIETAAGRISSRAGVDELFRQLGRNEAARGNDLQAIHAANAIATRDGWKAIRQFANAFGMSAEALGALGDELFVYMEHLTIQVSIGYDAKIRALAHDVKLNRIKLMDLLLAGSTGPELAALAQAAQWPVPEQLVIFAVDAAAQLPQAAFGDDVLVRTDGSMPILICAANKVAANTTSIETAYGRARVAVSWPVPVAEVPDAERWTRRALKLAALGVLSAEPGATIWCEEHVETLWLHSEPLLRRRLTHEILEPLWSMSTYTREGLATTLLAWLDSFGSAPDVAKTVEVHPQTVRYRFRRLREVFGDDLDQPDKRLAMYLSLRASMPFWEAGHADRDRNASARRARPSTDPTAG